MTKHNQNKPSGQSLLLTILFSILSCLFWGFIIVLLFQKPLTSWWNTQLLTDDLSSNASSSLDYGEETAIPLPTNEASSEFKTVVTRTVELYDYDLFLYPVSVDTRLPMDFPRADAEVPLVRMGEVSVAVMIEEPLSNLIADAKAAGFSPYLRSGFRSIDDQYTAFSRYVTEATTLGMDLKEAQAYARRFSAEPGYSEHHLGLAIDLLDYFYPDWIIARNNYNKGLYLWLRQHAHEYGFVISYPAGLDTTYAKPGSGYALSEPWHLRYVGKDLAVWMFEVGYLSPHTDVNVNEVLRKAYNLSGK
jgi:LAS superfamily LD-carboxypeptidase LdcB